MRYGRIQTVMAAGGVALGALACGPKAAVPSVSEAWESPAPVSAAATNENRADNSGSAPGARRSPAASERGRAAAVVNDRAISMEWLTRELLASHGIDLLAQRISLEVVRQEAQRTGANATPTEIDAEYDKTLRIGASGAGDVSSLTPERRRQLIEQWRTSRGVSASELHMAMERQALLRKIIETRLTPNEEKLREEFARIYGTKAECRHIVVASLRDAERLRPSIDAGEDFAILARRFSLNEVTGPNGGLLPPFTARDETVPGVLREAAFQMSPGQVSNPIKVDGQIHLLKLERRLEPEVVKYDSVRGAVERAWRERTTPVEMEKLFTDLQRRAALRIEDSTLRQQYRQRLREGRLMGPELQ